MYRPFMTCDDPKGVVDCGSIRKYKTSSSSQKMKDRTSKGRRPAEIFEAPLLTNKQDKAEKVLRESSERSFDSSPSTLQLMEVSRGAQKLNNMIDSWSRGGGAQRSEDIAKDLLKGALDLQESLAMLRKVQEASKYMARMKRKSNEKRESGSRIDVNLIGSGRTTYCDHCGEQSYPMGFQRPWPSTDGSSSSCREELKKVIKESLVRQNLLPGSTSEGLDSGSAFHSTNSSQSSVAWNENLSVSDASFSSATSRKERGSNLVAKLMGLEEAPLSSFLLVKQKQSESPKIMNQKRPIFEIDIPKVRKNSFVVEKVSPERPKTLKEILETTHFNGLLKKSSFREPKICVPCSNDSHYRHFDDMPPIVLMKPRYTPYQDFVKPREPVPPEEVSLRSLKTKHLPSTTFEPREDSTTNTGREMEEHLSKRPTKEERPKRLKEVLESDAKEIKPIENVKAPGSKVKLQSHVSHKLQFNETVDKKAKVKTVSISRKLPEKEVPKPKVVTKSQGQREISSTSTKLRKPQSVSRIDRNEIPGRKSVDSKSNTISKLKNKKISVPKEKEQRKIQMMKKQKSLAEPEAAKSVDEQLGKDQGRKSIDVSCKDDDSAEIKIITTVTDDLSSEHEVDAPTDEIREICKQSQCSSGVDILMRNSEHEIDAISANISEIETCNNTAELKHLLLTNPSFISHAEELLDLDLDCFKTQPKIETNEIADCRLYLDCANELMERKSLQGSQAIHPLLLTCSGNSRVHISLGKLVYEVCNAIENLTCYSENSEKKLGLDNIYSMMERDIKSKYGMMNGIWNCGWRYGFSADEAEQVVSEVENLVLSGLIEEVIVNL